VLDGGAFFSPRIPPIFRKSRSSELSFLDAAAGSFFCVAFLGVQLNDFGCATLSPLHTIRGGVESFPFLHAGKSFPSPGCCEKAFDLWSSEQYSRPDLVDADSFSRAVPSNAFILRYSTCAARLMMGLHIVGIVRFSLVAKPSWITRTPLLSFKKVPPLPLRYPSPSFLEKIRCVPPPQLVSDVLPFSTSLPLVSIWFPAHKDTHVPSTHSAPR